MSITSQQLEDLIQWTAQYAGPPNKIIMTFDSFNRLTDELSRIRRKDNRRRIKARRKAMGRGRW